MTKTGIVKLYRQDNQPFTIIPNKAIRDPKINSNSFRLLSYLMSHNDGYELAYSQIERETSLGSHAIREAVKKLISMGWLDVERTQLENGQYGPYNWIILTPDSEVATGNFSTLGDSTLEQSRDIKNKNNKEDKSKEYIPRTEFESKFQEFYSSYPKKADFKHARKSFDKAYAEHGDVIIEGAKRVASDPNLPPKQFIPNPATWLNRGGWLNEPYPPRVKTAQEIQLDAIQRAAEQRETEKQKSQAHFEELRKARESSTSVPDCEHGKPLIKCVPCCKRLAQETD